MTKPRIYMIKFGGVYPLYVKKIERKGRTVAELDEVLGWLTGYSADELADKVASDDSLEEFVIDAPAFNERAELIKGVICGLRVEEITDSMTQKIRYVDKVVDELAKGKAVEKIKR